VRKSLNLLGDLRVVPTAGDESNRASQGPTTCAFPAAFEAMRKFLVKNTVLKGGQFLGRYRQILAGFWPLVRP
jgi:hypothetical protein